MESQIMRILQSCPSKPYILISALIITAIFNAETNGNFTEERLFLRDYIDYEYIITSPHYPAPYPVFCNRSYLLQAPNFWYIVRVEIVNLEVEYDSTCSKNSLDIYDGDSKVSPRMAHLCGYLQNDGEGPRYIYSHGPNLYVTFTTDGGNRLGWYNGFEAKVRVVRSDGQAPGSRLPSVVVNSSANSLTWPATELEARYNEIENLTSLGYPNYYPPNYVHRWLIKARQNYFIKITIYDLQIEHHPTCSFDNLTIYDASVPNPSYVIQIARLCSPTPSASLGSGDYYSARPYLYLVFRTDSTGNGRGFKVGYQAVLEAGPSHACTSSSSGGLNLQASYGVTKYIESPNYPRNYQNNMDCGWLIRAPYGHVVRVRALVMDLEPSGHCQFDSVTLYDATSANTFNTIAQLCKEDDVDYYSRNNYMSVAFTTDSSKTATGFRLEYQAVRSSDRPVKDDDTTDSEGSSVSSVGVGGAVAGVVVAVVSITAISVSIVLIRRRTRRLCQQTASRVTFTRASGHGPAPGGRSDYAATNEAFDCHPPSYTELFPSAATGSSEIALRGFADLGMTGALDQEYEQCPQLPSYEEVVAAAKANEPTAYLVSPAANDAEYIALSSVEPSAPTAMSV